MNYSNYVDFEDFCRKNKMNRSEALILLSKTLEELEQAQK